ncbi:MAG: response regulator [Gammaproteobacteria bacterium]|nr:response regulator [Gammaproteobacteria bacterium]
MSQQLNKILYVEDEADIRTVAQLALEAVGGFTLEVCSKGEEAVAKAPAFNPDLILLDVMMPGMDGPGTLAALRNLPSLHHTPVIFMTAKVQPKEIQVYKALGALDVIAKPFDPMTLAEQVRTIWARTHG